MPLPVPRRLSSGRLTRMTLFRALAHRPFALVWAGQSVSRLGDGLYAIAVAWWVTEETGSAGALGLVLACFAAPQLVFVLLGGLAGDRFSRLRIMILCDLARAGAVGTVAVLAWSGGLAVWHLCVLSGVFGAVAATFFPAYVASVPDLLPAEDLTSANSLRFMSRQAAEIAGPGIGALLIAAGGTPLAFGLNGVSFLVAAGAVVAAGRQPGPRQRRRRPATHVGGAWRDLREGFATVAASPWLWVTIVVAGVSNLTFGGPQMAVLPTLVRDERGAGVGTLALLNGFLATGALVASVWIGRSHRTRRRGLVIYVAWVAAALLLAVVGLPVPLAVLGGTMLLLGATGAIVDLVWAHTVQELVPAERQSRVYSIDALGSYALLPLGLALGGVAADRFGPGPVLVGGGLVSAMVIGLGLLHPGVRGVD